MPVVPASARFSDPLNNKRGGTNPLGQQRVTDLILSPRPAMNLSCKSIGCCNPAQPHQDFCAPCQNRELDLPDCPVQSLAERYPDNYKTVGDLSEVDTYAVHHIFQIQDPSGCLQQASAKLLMTKSSKNIYRDVREARELLTRWLQLNQELNT